MVVGAASRRAVGSTSSGFVESELESRQEVVVVGNVVRADHVEHGAVEDEVALSYGMVDDVACGIGSRAQRAPRHPSCSSQRTSCRRVLSSRPIQYLRLALYDFGLSAVHAEAQAWWWCWAGTLALDASRGALRESLRCRRSRIRRLQNRYWSDNCPRKSSCD